MEEFIKNSPFRFWCQKVLPMVYDDSLSYYELLCKVVDYLNKVISSTNGVIDNVDELKNDLTKVEDWIKNFDTTYAEKIIAEYNQLKAENIEDNYFSLNYGDKYFGKNLAKIIGFIRQDIEDRKRNLTEKEYHILLSSLIYSMDRVSNTIGHYEAYLKKPIPEHYINMRLIDAHCFDNVRIFREDSNQLVRHVAADVFYVDPPYNSRQYSRFYHVYETLVHWDKRPLFGVAMKPQVENMSEYCSCRARDAFADLISNMDAKYIFVSYNNTYHSKSKSSQNKITLEEIRSILETKGETKILEHAYQFFNAGKTDFKDHKELLFVTKVYCYDK